MAHVTEIILLPLEGRGAGQVHRRTRTAVARLKRNPPPSETMSVTRRVAARRSNQLISQLNLQARLETELDGWYL